MDKLRNSTLKTLAITSAATHVIISFALVVATLLIASLFFYEVYLAAKEHTLIKGFLHALGVLLLLWTMVELISTEIRVLNGGDIDMAVFVEVALVVLVREIIMVPVKLDDPGWIDLGKWVGSALALGITYFLVRVGQRYHMYKKSI